MHLKPAARTFALIILSALAWLPATSLALDISQGWRFIKGDDAGWAQPEFDDSAWKPIDVGTPWEKAGHEGYDGYGWYRLRVSVPTAVSEGDYFNTNWEDSRSTDGRRRSSASDCA